ncbi:type II toxin-antitoxin system Phd/YefM family antitoxin [Oscillatoria sp. FACHB-1406]|uniref:type II toxin-antitoxin system Phd/YefM family antitoxin n=1 Tax=Oscillatoria sp. FACHB-1406 TaxID=2692846 RepID=UPI00168256DA|nr:type II toxin-antitoxin system Phd/YefM family antitoxin [Oscillatoria sp. FACHB-1406]MBD2576449.1 type II toxin-antitoxin system Phd/YefM family antitoxin [Oscillatoria sp. FACHB-1406]
MDSIGIDQFRDRFQHWIDRVIDRHQPLKVTGQSGSDFIVVSAKDWEQTQETLYVLQNSALMKQISASLTTHVTGKGYQPSAREIDEIFGV